MENTKKKSNIAHQSVYFWIAQISTLAFQPTYPETKLSRHMTRMYYGGQEKMLTGFLQDPSSIIPYNFQASNSLKTTKKDF